MLSGVVGLFCSQFSVDGKRYISQRVKSSRAKQESESTLIGITEGKLKAAPMFEKLDTFIAMRASFTVGIAADHD